MIPARADVAVVGAGTAGAPRFTVRAADMAARMIAARALHARYPREPARLGRWSHAVARVFRERPDVGYP